MQSVVQTLPNLLALDITGCKFHPETLQLLGQHCPQLQVLRLGACLPALSKAYLHVYKCH